MNEKRIFLLLACGVLFALFLFGASAADHTLVYTVDGRDVYADDIEAGREASLFAVLSATDLTSPALHSEGGTVVLHQDVTFTSTVFIGYSLSLDLNGHTVTGTADTMFRQKGRVENGTFAYKPNIYLYSSVPGGVIYHKGGTTFFSDDGATTYIGQTAEKSKEYAQNLTVYSRKLTTGYGSGFYIYGGTFVQLSGASNAFVNFDSGGLVYAMEDCTIVMTNPATPVFNTFARTDSLTYRRLTLVLPDGISFAQSGAAVTFTLEDCSVVGTAPASAGNKTINYTGTLYASDLGSVTKSGSVGATDTVGKTVTYTKADRSTGSKTLTRCFTTADRALALTWQDGKNTVEYFTLGSVPTRAIEPYVQGGSTYTPKEDHWTFEFGGADVGSSLTVTSAMLGKSATAKMTYASAAVAYILDGTPVYVTDVVKGTNDIPTLLTDAAYTGSTIVLTQDYSASEQWLISHDVKIDLAGHTLTFTGATGFHAKMTAAQQVGSDPHAYAYIYSSEPGAKIEHTANGQNATSCAAFFSDDKGAFYIGYSGAGTYAPAGYLTVRSPKMSTGYGIGFNLYGTDFIQTSSAVTAMFVFDSWGYLRNAEKCRFFLSVVPTLIDTRSLDQPTNFTDCTFIGTADAVIAPNTNKQKFTFTNCTFIDFKIHPSIGTAAVTYSGSTAFNLYDRADVFGSKVAAFGDKNAVFYTDAEGKTVKVNLNGCFADPASVVDVFWEGPNVTERYAVGVRPARGDGEDASSYFEGGYICTPGSWVFSLDGAEIEGFTVLTSDQVGKTVHATAGVSRVPAAFTVKVGDTVTGYPAGADEIANGALLLTEIGKQTSAFTVTLYADAKVASAIALEKFASSFDLNGHTLSAAGGLFSFKGSAEHKIYSSVPGGVLLTTGTDYLIRSDVNPRITIGEVAGADGDNLSVYANTFYSGWTNGATLTLRGGHYYFLTVNSFSPDYLIFGSGSYVTFDGATVYTDMDGTVFYLAKKNIGMTMKDTLFISMGDELTLLGADSAVSAQITLTDCRFVGMDTLSDGKFSNIVVTSTAAGAFLYDAAGLLDGAKTDGYTKMRTARSATAEIAGVPLTVRFGYTLSKNASDAVSASLTFDTKTLTSELWEIGQKPSFLYEKEGFLFFAASDSAIEKATAYDAQVKCGEGKVLFYVDIRTALDDLFAIRNDGTVRSLTPGRCDLRDRRRPPEEDGRRSGISALYLFRRAPRGRPHADRGHADGGALGRDSHRDFLQPISDRVSGGAHGG